MLILKSLEAILAREEPVSSRAPFADIRVQVALARTLLDEVERQVPSSTLAQAVTEQFIEEFAQLGCRILEAATELASGLDGRPNVAPTNAEASAGDREGLRLEVHRLADARVRKVIKGRASTVARTPPRARSTTRSQRTTYSAPSSEPRCPLWARKLV